MRRRMLLLVAVLAAGSVGGALLAGRASVGGASALSRGPSGWHGFLSYLNARGLETALSTSAWSELPENVGVFVIGFPWSVATGLDGGVDGPPVTLRRGGDVVIGYSAGRVPGGAELALLERLGASWVSVGWRPSLVPWRWSTEAREPWTLDAGPELDGAAPLSLRAQRWRPAPPEEAQPLWLAPDGSAVAWWYPMQNGRVVLMPAELLSNARLSERPHAAWLETLAARLDGPWWFDELHHGLGSVAEATSAGRRSLDLVAWHVAALYLVSVLTLGRRMGPAWREPPVAVGSARAFLTSLGRRHDRLGHATEAAVRLVERAARLDPRLQKDRGLAERAQRADREELLALARDLSRSSIERPKGEST